MVIGQDGAVIFVRHGGTYVRVHHSRLQKVDTSSTGLEVLDNQRERPQNPNKLPETELRENFEPENDIMEQVAPENGLTEAEDVSEPPQMTELSNRDTHGSSETLQTHSSKTSDGLKIKIGQEVTFTNNESGQKYAGKIISRAGKATGTHRHWYNIQYSGPEDIAGSAGSVNLEKVSDLQIVPSERAEVCTDSHKNEILIVDEDIFIPAKQTELDNWKKNSVCDEVKDEGQKCISTRWVCTLKETSDGVVPKARLVARGFEEINTEELQKDSPTCASESLKMIMALICENKWQLNSMDIKAAFLQGKELTRSVYIRPPQEAQRKGYLWKLKKCVYGLADASLYWYNRVKDTMKNLGASVSQVDPAVFYWLDDSSKVMGVLACHVDDFIWGGTEKFTTTVIPHLKAVFQVGREEHSNFSLIGMDIRSLEDEIQVQQSDYIKNLQPILVDPSRATQRESPLTAAETEILKSKIGQTLWVERQSRPDIMCDISMLASGTKHANVQTLHCANKLIRKLKSEEVTLRFQHLGKDSSLKVVVFSDSSMGNLPDGGTQGGHFIMLMGDNGRFSPLCWQS